MIKLIPIQFLTTHQHRFITGELCAWWLEGRKQVCQRCTHMHRHEQNKAMRCTRMSTNVDKGFGSCIDAAGPNGLCGPTAHLFKEFK